MEGIGFISHLVLFSFFFICVSTYVGERVGVGEHELSRKNWDIKDRNSAGYLSAREHRSTMCKVLALNPSAPYAYTHRQDRGCSNLFVELFGTYHLPTGFPRILQ